MKWLFLTLCLLLVSVTVQGQESTCGLDTQFETGQTGWVTPGSPNNVRAEPSRTARLMGQIPAGDTFTVLETGACADGFTWIKVKFQGDDELLDGWTAEADGARYFVEPLDGEIVQLENVSFILPTELEGIEIEAAFGPETEPEDQWDIVPYAEFVFSDYLDETNAPSAQIQVLDPEEFEDELDPFSGAVRNSAEGLPLLLEERPDLAETKEIYEFSVASVASIRVFPEYIDFEGGSGYRFLTYFTQNVGGPSDQIITYAFVGITDSGDYLIVAEFPLLAPDMPPQFDYSVLSEDDDTAFKAVAEFNAELIAFYESFEPDEYQPTLETLDKLIASIRIVED